VMFSDPAALSRRDAAASLAPIAWAWASSGASRVILRRWGGDEPSAAEVLREYYEQLRAGTCPAEAIAAARDSIRSTKGGEAPARWAGWLDLGVRSQPCR
jgi:CHAT domain-containing protein